MTFAELRAASGMTQKRFGEYFHVPLRTVENWSSGTSKCPEYLLELMIYKLEKEGIVHGGTL